MAISNLPKVFWSLKRRFQGQLHDIDEPGRRACSIKTNKLIKKRLHRKLVTN